MNSVKKNLISLDRSNKLQEFKKIIFNKEFLTLMILNLTLKKEK
jgi:hypothetical protein